MLYQIRPQTHEEWLAHRRMGIGSSEVATILGLNPWQTRLELWRSKMGIDAPQEENFAMKAGHYLEDAVSKFWADETGNTIIKSSAGDWLYFDDEAPHRRVSPDRTFFLAGKPKNNENKGILECKTTQMRIDKDDIPKHWFCQLQYQLGVSGLKHGALAWLVAGREFGHEEFKFNPQFFVWICEEVDKFYADHIVGGIEPEPTNAKDVLLKYNQHTEGKELEATAELCEHITNLKLLKEKKKLIEADIAEAEEAVKLAMQDAERLTLCGQTLATWKASAPAKKLDTKALSKEVADKYTIVVPGTRRFLVK